MSRRDFGAVLDSIRESQEEIESEREIRDAGNSAAAGWALVGALVMGAFWIFQDREGPYMYWWVGGLVALAIVLFVQSIRSMTRFERAAKIHDRGHFIRSIEAAETLDELEQAGLPLSVNLISIAADELAQEWDAFGPHNEPRERMLIKLHEIADLRKLADQVEEIKRDADAEQS